MPSNSRPLHVLIADDEPMLRSVLVEFIETLENRTCAEVADGIEALEYLRGNPVDCLLSDARMPRMDLEELLDIIGTEYPGLIVVATSGYSDLESASRILERGAHEFLAKPLNLDLLESSLNWIARRAALLGSAGEAFAGSGRDMTLNYARPFQSLRVILEAVDAPFSGLMRHACRVGDLADRLTQQEDAAFRNELQLAALLHEVGCSSQYLATIASPRKLTSNELRFIRTQNAVGGRLLENALPGCPAGMIVRRHLTWSDFSAAEERAWDDVQRMACLLGVVNVVDGLLQERPDRPRHQPGEALEILKKLYASTNLSTIKHVMTQWPTVRDYYASSAAL